MKPITLAGLGTLLVVLVALSTLPDSPARAAPGSIDLVAVDADSTNGPPAGGNFANDIGPADRCISIANGASVVIDIVVDSVPPADPITYLGGINGIGLDVLYDMRVVNVAAWATGEDASLYYSNGFDSPVVNVADPLPDADGRYRIDSAEIFPGQLPESGDGILARITFQGMGQGLSILRVTDVVGETDLAKGTPRVYAFEYPLTNNTAYPINSVQDGVVAVGVPCPADPADADGDTIPNEADNCPTTRNGPAQASAPGTGNQSDSDSDGTGDACEDRDRDSETPESHLCQGTCPGGAFRDSIEAIVGTNPVLRCASTSSANDESGADAWPLDFNDDQRANTVDIGQFVPVLNDPAPARFDLNANGVINTVDIGQFVPALNENCSSVLDQFDACPGSLASVDTNGCSSAQVDWDGDGICNPGAPSGGPGNCTGSDNCWRAQNVAQTDTDSDRKGNACDPEGPSPNSDGVDGADDCSDGVDNDGDGQTDSSDPLCSPGGDSDNDTFTDGFEVFLGTLPNDPCADTPIGNNEPLPDAWPPDLNDDQRPNGVDAGRYVPYIGSAGTSPYDIRMDLVPDGTIGWVDTMLIGIYRQSSTTDHCFDF